MMEQMEPTGPSNLLKKSEQYIQPSRQPRQTPRNTHLRNGVTGH